MLEINFIGYLKSMFKRFLILPIVLGIFFSSSNSFSYSRSVTFKEQKKQLIDHSLIGIVISKKTSSSVAVLRNEKSGETRIYRQGDDILGLVITHIHKDRIILQDSEYAFQIFLEHGFSDRVSSEYQAFKEGNESVITKEYSPLNSFKQYKSSREEFISFEATKIIINEWPYIQRETRFTPYREEGRVRGFRITRLPQNSILSEIGIQENDVINEINGIAINDSTNLIQLMNKSGNSDQIKVGIERDNLIFSLIFILR